MMLHTNGNKKKAGITMLISDKIDFKTHTVTRVTLHYITLHYKEGHYMMKGSIQKGKNVGVHQT